MRRFRLTLLVLALSVAAVPAIVAAPPAVGAGAALGPGSTGAAVKALQRALELTADGHFGPATVRAVRRFQRRHGLRITGRVDAATRAALRPSKAPARTGGAEAGTEATAPALQPGAPASARAADLVNAAGSVLGTRYAQGGASPAGFDCSGLVVWSAAAAGLTLPRSSFEQYRAGRPVAREAIVGGDLVFFDTGGPGASDVGIATSPSTVISATTHGVREHPVFGDYWGEHFVGARRIG